MVKFQLIIQFCFMLITIESNCNDLIVRHKRTIFRDEKLSIEELNEKSNEEIYQMIRKYIDTNKKKSTITSYFNEALSALDSFSELLKSSYRGLRFYNDFFDKIKEEKADNYLYDVVLDRIKNFESEKKKEKERDVHKTSTTIDPAFLLTSTNFNELIFSFGGMILLINAILCLCFRRIQRNRNVPNERLNIKRLRQYLKNEKEKIKVITMNRNI